MAKRILIWLALAAVLAPVSFGADNAPPEPAAETQKAEWWVNTAIAIVDKAEGAAQKEKMLRDIFHVALNADMFDEAGQILKQSGDPLSPASMIDIVRAQLKRGLIAEALKTAGEMPEILGKSTRDNAYKSIALAQVEAKKYSDALATVNLIYDGGLKTDVTFEIAAAQVDAGDPGARELLARWLQEKEISRGWSKIIALQNRLGLFDDAKALASKIREDCYRIEALGIIAKAQADAEKMNDAAQTMAEAANLAESAAQKNPSRLQYLAVAQANMGMIKEALATLRRIDLPWTEVYTTIAEAQFKAGDKDAALKTYADAVETAKKYESNQEESALYHIALSQIRCGFVAEALQNGASPRSYDPGGVRYFAVKKYVEMSKFSDAIALAESAKRADLLILIAKGQLKAGLREDAAQTYKKAADFGKKIRNYADIIGHVRFTREELLLDILRSQIDAGFIEDASATAKELKDASPEEAYTFPHDQLDESQKRAIIERASPSGLLFASQAWYMIALSQAKGGNFARALETAEVIEDITVRALAVCGVAGLQAAAGKAEDAARNFSSAIALVKQEQKPLGEKYVRAIGAAMARAGALTRLAETMEVLKERPTVTRVAFCLGAAEGLLQKQQEEESD